MPSSPFIGWWVHTLVLAAYPVGMGLMGFFMTRGSFEGTVLPTQMGPLLKALLVEMGLFLVVFGAAWAASRARLDALRLRWKDGFLPVVRGVGYSVLLRVAIGIVVTVVVQVALLLGNDPKKLKETIQPKTELIVDAQVLVERPAYLLVNLTLVSFVVAGFREELWRAGVLAGAERLFPDSLKTRGGQFAAVAVIALIFGFGHLPQGLGAVGITSVLGLGLGWILLRHQSIWDAVLAHGFFNATTLFLIYLMEKHFPGQLPF